MIILNINMVTTQDLFTDTDSLKLKRKMYMKILVRIKKCLILAIILLSQNIMMIQTN